MPAAQQKRTQRKTAVKGKAQKGKKEDISGILVGAAVCFGIGLGFLFDRFIAFLFIGIAVGLLLKFWWLKKE